MVRLFPAPSPSRLLFAAEGGDVEAVAELLRDGADVNETSADGWTPLIVAAKEGHLATLDVLLSAGAHPDPRDNISHSALRGAAISGHMDACRRMLTAGALVNQTSGGGRTPLMGAAMHGHAEAVALLCAHGADPSLRNELGEDAAALAKLHSHHGCLAELARAGRLPTLVASAAPPSGRVRTSSNQPEARRNSILERLARDGARQLMVPCRGSAALDAATRLGVLTQGKRRLLDTAHEEWTAGGCNRDLAFKEAAGQTGGVEQPSGVVPFFFTRARPDDAASLARRLAWHATDSITPLYHETCCDLQADASLVLRTCELLLSGCPLAYALTTHPGHHASSDLYGGYCFVNWACMLVAALREAGKQPFLLDLDYHAGDGSAEILEGRGGHSPAVEPDWSCGAPAAGAVLAGAGQARSTDMPVPSDAAAPEEENHAAAPQQESHPKKQKRPPGGAAAGGAPAPSASLSRVFASLHAADDYPFVPEVDAARWAVPVPAGSAWPAYAELLRGALCRIPEGCDVLVISLGYDTLRADPEAFNHSALGLTPPDYGEMAKLICGTGRAVAVIQEGGYKMDEIPEAAAHFWAAAAAEGLK